MRTVVAAVAAALLSVPLAGPAAAAGAVDVTCAVRDHHGGGPTSGSAACTVTGVVNGTPYFAAPASMSFNAWTNCPLQDATGVMSGALDVAFAWSRVGANVVITTTGDINGAGEGVFSSPCPAYGETLVFTLAGP